MKVACIALLLAGVAACGSGNVEVKEEIRCRTDARGNQICTVYRVKEEEQ